ncbi:MAG: 50S ribosomal protein L23 [Chlamydiia bacterium]|nr:50S ribosomal protein L23 [Bdellovibrionales bacterium]MCB1115112.1 50S ribosomal protein L23 [Chlamydiia bacterium]
MYDIIKKPLLTEKSTAYGEYGTYVFEVTRDATKTDIRNAVEKAFDVKVKDVRTLVYRTKWLKKHARFGPPKYKKKAFVKLVEGQTISIFEGA